MNVIISNIVKQNFTLWGGRVEEQSYRGVADADTMLCCIFCSFCLLVYESTYFNFILMQIFIPVFVRAQFSLSLSLCALFPAFCLTLYVQFSHSTDRNGQYKCVRLYLNNRPSGLHPPSNICKFWRSCCFFEVFDNPPLFNLSVSIHGFSDWRAQADATWICGCNCKSGSAKILIRSVLDRNVLSPLQPGKVTFSTFIYFAILSKKMPEFAQHRPLHVSDYIQSIFSHVRWLTYIALCCANLWDCSVMPAADGPVMQIYDKMLAFFFFGLVCG